ncbi:MAG: hypothetical protein WA936_13095 [Erythrobacter sp.]|uniref:hypothetical protein n=1 Tax=Erythrobacter sp. TaxID=1042 RepID=UPI003C78A5B8
MSKMTIRGARPQQAIDQTPYDRWVSPQGVCMAEFYRRDDGYLARFPGQVDFSIPPLIENGETKVRAPKMQAWPVPDCPERIVSNLYRNAILPIIGNHQGGLFLHGSAVAITLSDPSDPEDAGHGAAAFLGLSRSGKTTLAGAFAKAGHPFVTEDVIDLRLRDGTYWLEPKASKLRLFGDSARHLLGDGAEGAKDVSGRDEKQDVEGGDVLPFRMQPVPLRAVHVLGGDPRASLSITPLAPPAALAALLPHAFILDVEDKSALKAHFERLADLTASVPCLMLDYTRDYGELAAVMDAVLAEFGAGTAASAASA